VIPNECVAPPPRPGASRRGTGAADLVGCSVATTARATIGAVTTAGRMIRVSVIEIPASTSGGAGTLSAGHPVAEFVPGLVDGETVLALASLDGDEASGVALGTASGVVKRVQPEYPANRDEFELITLKDDDRVIGAAYLTGDDAELVFITSDAQLLRFAATSVRPQGRPAGGMAGVRLSDGASAIWFGAIAPRSPGPSAHPSGQPAQRARGHPRGRHGGHGRPARRGNRGGTWRRRVGDHAGGRHGGRGHGVRPFRRPARHRRRVGQGHPLRRVPAKGPSDRRRPLPALPEGEDGLIQAWIGPTPVIGVTESGIVVDLSGMTGRRDGSGNAITRQLAHLGHPFGTS